MIKNVAPLYLEVGNWVIFPNHNIILPNSNDILKSSIIKNGSDQNITYLYSVDKNVNLVEIQDINGSINKISGNVIKVNEVDSTTTMYSFKTLMTIDVDVDSTGAFELSHFGIVNNFISLDSLNTNTLTNKKLITKFKGNTVDDYASVYRMPFYIK